MYPIFGKVNRYFEEINGNKCLTLVPAIERNKRKIRKRKRSWNKKNKRKIRKKKETEIKELKKKNKKIKKKIKNKIKK